MLLFEGLFSELFRREPKSASMYVCVCLHACVGESSSRNITGKDDWGIHSMTCRPFFTHTPSPVTLKYQPPAFFQEVKEGLLPEGTQGRGNLKGPTTQQANFQQTLFFTREFTLTFLLEFSLLINTEQLSFFRVKQLCPHLSASNWLSPFFICQGNYHSSIHFSPSKNLLKAFMANCLSFSLALLLNLF